VNGCQVGVIGASSFVGGCVLSRLTQLGCRVTAYSRSLKEGRSDGVVWRQLSPHSSPYSAPGQKPVNHWICSAPIWVLPEHFALLEAHRAQRVVVLSSTSRLTKSGSPDLEEQAVARRLAEAESYLQVWAEERGIDWVVLRPTLIYGLGRDQNIGEIARFIRRFRFFPLFGKADGLRQPIHAQDVADACVDALRTSAVRNRTYNISGGETLTYREMVNRIFKAMDRPPFLLRVPLFAFRASVSLVRLLPRCRHWSAAMAERMNRDLVFDHGEASQDFAFQPRKFDLSAQDLPE